MPGIVDALHGLDIIAGRMYSVGVDFLLAGPVNLWLQGLRRGRVEPLYLLLITRDPENIERARRAAQPLSEPAPWPEPYSSIVEGRVESVRLRGGFHLAIAADPVVRTQGENRIIVASHAKSARIAVVNGRPVRLAPLGLELLLMGEYGES